MHSKLSQIFKNIPEVDPPLRLEKAILSRIEKLDYQSLKRKLTFSYLGLAFSGLATVWTFIAFGQKLLNSEFWSILSLIFSDARIVLNYWQEFGSSLLETLPAAHIAAILLPILIFFIFSGLYFDSRNKPNNYLTN